MPAPTERFTVPLREWLITCGSGKPDLVFEYEMHDASDKASLCMHRSCRATSIDLLILVVHLDGYNRLAERVILKSHWIGVRTLAQPL